MAKPLSITNGRSTDPQMKVLLEAFAKLAPGQELSYTDATILLNEPVQSDHCYRASRRAMKRHFETTGSVVERVRGCAFRRLTADEQVDGGADGMRDAAKRWSDSGRKIQGAADGELSDVGRARKDCLVLANLAIARAIEDQNKQLKAAYKATPALPQTKA